MTTRAPAVLKRPLVPASQACQFGFGVCKDILVALLVGLSGWQVSRLDLSACLLSHSLSNLRELRQLPATWDFRSNPLRFWWTESPPKSAQKSTLESRPAQKRTLESKSTLLSPLLSESLNWVANSLEQFIFLCDPLSWAVFWETDSFERSF